LLKSISGIPTFKAAMLRLTLRQNMWRSMSRAISEIGRLFHIIILKFNNGVPEGLTGNNYDIQESWN
jgi:hypothetical protein